MLEKKKKKNAKIRQKKSKEIREKKRKAKAKEKKSKRSQQPYWSEKARSKRLEGRGIESKVGRISKK